jgi:hypothetical protein
MKAASTYMLQRLSKRLDIDCETRQKILPDSVCARAVFCFFGADPAQEAGSFFWMKEARPLPSRGFFGMSEKRK